MGPQNGGQFWTDEKKQTIVISSNKMYYLLNIDYDKVLLDNDFLFLFLRDTDSIKGKMCPICVPIH